MKEVLVLLMILFLISGIYAQCNETQININTALAEELIEIKHIGEVRAEEIITLRPFQSVDALINISGIGEFYLSKIKEQGLACVDEEISKEPEEQNETEEENNEISDIIEDFKEESEESDEPKKSITFDTISLKPLNPKDIKSSNHEEKSENMGNYAIYGFVVFCILIAVLFMLKIRKRKFSEFI